MTRSRTLTSVVLAAGLWAAPALAQQDRMSGTAPATAQLKPEMSQAGRACLDRLEQIDRQLSDIGYGRAGPDGYGVYGPAYGATALDGGVVGAQGTGALDRPLRITPRADMYALMRAGYVLARTGQGEGCQQIAQAAEDLGKRYETAVSGDDFDRVGMSQWRLRMLADATPVAELDQPLRAEEIIGADLRNPEDRDFGDVSDVVIGRDGRIQYVIVHTGGFLGLGEEAVPVPWHNLKVTPRPYRETLVLETDAQTFSQAPRIITDVSPQLVTGRRSQQIDDFWDKNLPDEG